jgi:hypothetical protein
MENQLPEAPDLLTEELQKLDPGELWDVILGNETLDEHRKRRERHMVCAAHERSLGDRMERAVWEAYAKRHGLAKPKGFAYPMVRSTRGMGFG